MLKARSSGRAIFRRAGKPQKFQVILKLVQPRDDGIDAARFRFGRLDRVVR